MSDHMNKYAEFISKQQKELRGSTVNTISEINESKEDPKITDKVIDHTGLPDEMVAHVATHGTHGTYSLGDTHWSYDGEKPSYITHDTKTGKTHDFTLPAKKVTVDHVKNVMDKAIPGGVHMDHAKAVAADHNG